MSFKFHTKCKFPVSFIYTVCSAHNSTSHTVCALCFDVCLIIAEESVGSWDSSD
jgi:hypothetical protein